MKAQNDIIVEAHESGNRIDIEFLNNSFVQQLYGDHDSNLSRIEASLNVTIASRGNRVIITGDKDRVERAKSTLETLWKRLEEGMEISAHEVNAVLRMHDIPKGTGKRSEALATLSTAEMALTTTRKRITPRNPNQAAYLKALSASDLVFGLGPAGTGKTYLAVAQAVSMMLSGQIDRIILSRPAVEAGERLGFLPGDLKEKVDPYLRPLYDALYDMLPADQVERKLLSGEIEIAPLAFMRGRTLSNAFVILDEAQNTTSMQMKMLLTRLGENSRMVITGDTSQIDLPKGVLSGLKEAVHILRDTEGVSFVTFNHKDVVRHPLVSRIVLAYDKNTQRKNEARKLDGQDIPYSYVE